MSDPLIRDLENYVILEPGQEEKILSTKETLAWLEGWLNEIKILPEDLAKISSPKEASKRLLDTACSLEIKTGFIIQWFAVRLEPPSG